MLAKQLLFAATAAAFLVVPDTPKDGEGIFRTLPAAIEPFELPASALSQSIEVPCRHCKGRDSHLKMDFEVQGDGKALMLNGFELYPNADPWHGDLVADVLRANGKPKEQRLGYGLAVRPEAVDERQHLEIIGVELRVVEVGRRFIGGVPTVKVKLIKAATGDIVIGGIDLLAPPPKNQCTTIICRAKALAKDTWKSIKGCDKGHGPHGTHGPHGHQHGHGHDNLVLEGGKRPESPDHPHSYSWGKLFENVASYIFLPVVLGLVAGFGVALYVQPRVSSSVIANDTSIVSPWLSALSAFVSPVAFVGAVRSVAFAVPVALLAVTLAVPGMSSSNLLLKRRRSASWTLMKMLKLLLLDMKITKVYRLAQAYID
jgi:hypothetical protein